MLWPTLQDTENKTANKTGEFKTSFSAVKSAFVGVKSFAFGESRSAFAFAA